MGRGIKPPIVRSAILATLWLVPFVLFFLAFRCGWHAVWTAVGVPADALPFADLRSITGAVVTLQKHGDPLLSNPADPWNRVMNYPRIWVYLFSVLGINCANGKVFSVFGAIYAFSFAIGSNWDYRLIFLLPTLPFVLEMIRTRAHCRWAMAYVAAVMVAENPLDLRSIHGTALSHLATFFLFLMVLGMLTRQYQALLQERGNWGLGKATEVRAGAERPSGA